MNYNLGISDEANEEFDSYVDFILIDCSNPIDAAKHANGIRKAIRDLRRNPFISAKQDSITLIQYGYGVRRINFKKMAIIYTVSENTIYIHRFIPQSMIKGL